MLAFVVRRLLAGIPVVLVGTLVAFLLVTARGDPLADLRHRPGVSVTTIHALEHQYHLDEPKPQRYLAWLGDFVRGDWGRSYRTEQPVTQIIGNGAWNTFLLVAVAVLLSAALAMLLGVMSAVRRGSAFDHAVTGFSYFGYSMPDFFFALLLQLGLVVLLRNELGVHLFFVQGKYSVGHEGELGDLARHMVLPVVTVMLTCVAAWSRYQRSSMLEALRGDYIRTARAKGVPWRQVVRRHALPNVLVPFVTVVAVDTGMLLGGMVVVERIFAWPGLGLVFFQALSTSDYPVLLAWMAVATVFVVLANLVADILYGVLDPRIRVSGAVAT